MNIQQLKHDFVIGRREEWIERSQRDNNDYRNPNVKQENQDLINRLTEIALNEGPWDKDLTDSLLSKSSYHARRFLQSILKERNPQLPNHSSSYFWSIDDLLIQKLLWYQHFNHPDMHHICWGFASEKLTKSNGPDCDKLIAWIRDQGFEEQEMVEEILKESSYWGHSSPFEFIRWEQDGSRTLCESAIGRYLKPRLHTSSSFLGLKKNKGLGEAIHQLIENSGKNSRIWNDRFKLAVLKFLYENAPKLLEGRYKVYLTRTGYRTSSPNLSCLFYLLEKSPKAFEKYALEFATSQEVGDRENFQFPIYQKLNQLFHPKYDKELSQIGEEVLSMYTGTPPKGNNYFSYPYVRGGKSIPIQYSDYLLRKDKESGIQRIQQFVQESFYLTTTYLKFLEERLGEEAIPILIEAIDKDARVVDSYYKGYFKTLFELLHTYDVSSYTDKIVDYTLKNTHKKSRRIATNFLADYLPYVEGRAKELLKGKVNERVVGALILSHSKDPITQQELLELVDTERNDDTRDILLESLADLKFAQPYSLNEVKEMVEIANKRKKLTQWREKWLEEESLPKLYWQENGEALSPAAIRFLFYRSRRPKGLGLNSDIEARQLIGQIDKDRSGKFAKRLLQAFQESNIDSKCKYYMTLAGLLGNDEVLNKLHTLFRKSMSERRYKMGEYCVGAMVMIGSDKALRIVEMISRKFMSKRPRISKAAVSALDTVSTELNLSREQLGDRIIPNFDFENLYKTFEVDGESYRAFVSKEFKLHYFDSNNKLRKSPPKGTPKELLTELKTINKEIKDVVRTQKGRLEQFLVNERKWPQEEWSEYYLNNPIMLIYVQRLLWGVFRGGEIANIFYCDEDLELYDIHDEEVELEAGDSIGIVHPLHMSEKVLEKWKEKVYDMDWEFEFPILGRGVHSIEESEKERSQTLVLNGTDIPKGADFVAGFLEKRGWIKGTGDGGSLNFTKVNPYTQFRAWANIEGPAAYYQGGDRKATLYEVYFRGEDISKPPKLSELPPVFYSEVIADLIALSEA